MTAVVLLALLAGIVAFAWNKLRGRFGLKPSARTWIGPALAFVLLMLLLWASTSHPGR